GVAGDFVEIASPHSEGDPAALLVQFLAAVGNTFGRDPHVQIEGDTHPGNLYVAIVGNTSSGRKGTSWGRVKQVMELADPSWVDNNITGGLSSGEGLIWNVRDPHFKQLSVTDDDGRPTGEYDEVMADEGIEDKRLFIYETEFSKVLRVMKREASIVSV